MEKQFVTFEIAKRLKELGFDEKCIGTYRKWACTGNPFDYNIDYHTKVQMDHGLCPRNSEYVNDWVTAPLWQQALSWLRNIHQLNITIHYELHMKWWFSIEKAPYTEDDATLSFPVDNFEGFDTYETALEAGLQEALNLIII